MAGNIANADTPGYRRRDLAFPSLLDDKLGLMRSTHPKHFPIADFSEGGYQVELGPRGTTPDRNGVELDRELIHMSRNSGAYGDQAALISRLFGLTRTAISGEG